MILYYLTGYPINQIATLLDVSVSAVKNGRKEHVSISKKDG